MTAIGAAFCDTSQRAILLFDNREVISIDAAGTIRKLGNTGVVANGLIVCDRQDRIVIASGKQLVTLQGGTTKTDRVTADVRHMRLLDDGSIGIVDEKGAVYRHGARPVQAWTTGRTMLPPFELDGTGERIVAIAGGKIDVTDRNGRHSGPRAISVTWLDNETVLFGERTGFVGRWPHAAPADKFSKVDQPVEHVRFVRPLFYRAGRRVLVQRNNDAQLLSLAFDARGVPKPALISRVPGGRRIIAAGDAPFAVVVVDDRAIVVDLEKPSFAIDHHRPLGPVDAMAFSPDGRELAMLGGDRDIIIATLDRARFRRLTTTGLVRGPLGWSPDGTIFAGSGRGHVRWNLDGTVEERPDRAVGFTPAGRPITFTRDLRIVIDRGPSEQTIQLHDPMFGVMKAEVTDRYLVVRGGRRVAVYALDAGDDMPIMRTRERGFLREAALVGEASVMYVDNTSVYLADAKGDRLLEALMGVPQLAVSRDKRRVAIATRDELAIWDAQGQRVARMLTTGATIYALAWSPDLRTLAVSTKDGIELWTIPR